MTIDQLARFIKASTHHNSLYHFTDESNLQSIGIYGLLSKVQLASKGLWPPSAPGGNQLSWDLDRNRGIDQYISLCLTKNHPMKYIAHKDERLLTPRYLHIDSDVLKIPGVKIAFGIANANDVVIKDIVDGLDDLDREVLYTRTDWKDPDIQARLRAAERCEILVPNHVPRNLIQGYT